jgi:hypothetical protein
MRAKLRKLLRDFENESGFRNEYSEYSEADNCSYEVTESIDFPNFRLIGKEFNERYPTTYAPLLLYSDTATRTELVRMESDGIVLIGTQKAIIQGVPNPSNAGPYIENAESTTERVILTTQGKNAFRYFIHKITKEPVLFLFSLAALIISIVSLYLGLAHVDITDVADIPKFEIIDEARLSSNGGSVNLFVADTKGQLGKIFLFSNNNGSISTTLSVENPNVESPSFRVVKGQARDWLVVTTIENSGTGYLKHIDTWYVANSYYQANLAVLSYPSGGHITGWSDQPNQNLTTNIRSINDEDKKIEVEFILEICVAQNKCTKTVRVARYVLNNDKFVLNEKQSEISASQIDNLLTVR